MSDLISREAAIAIFQPENSAVRKRICDDLRALAPSPGCEPVAWLCEDLIFEGERSVIMKEDHAKARMARKEDWRVIPLYAHPPAAPVAKVKPLSWEHGHKFCGQECSYADTEFGAWMMVAYSGRGLRWAHSDPAGNDSEDDWETRDECQAAANADYQARILAALEGGEA